MRPRFLPRSSGSDWHLSRPRATASGGTKVDERVQLGLPPPSAGDMNRRDNFPRRGVSTYIRPRDTGTVRLVDPVWREKSDLCLLPQRASGGCAIHQCVIGRIQRFSWASESTIGPFISDCPPSMRRGRRLWAQSGACCDFAYRSIRRQACHFFCNYLFALRCEMRR